MRAIVCSDQLNLTAPLSALLREVDVPVHTTSDVFEALDAARSEPACVLVLDGRLDAADVTLAVRGARRHLDARHLLIVVGTAPSPGAVDGGVAEVWHEDAFAFVAVRDAAAAHAASVASAPEPAAPPPDAAVGRAPAHRKTTDADIDAALDRARTGSYYECLGVTRGAAGDAIRAAAEQARAAFARDALAPNLVDVRLPALTEIRAAIDDAEAVLTDPIARRWYDRGLDLSGDVRSS